MRYLKKYISKLSSFQQWTLMVFVIMALLSNIIANDKWVVTKVDGHRKFWVDNDKAKKGIKTIIPYSYNSLDNKNRKVGPFSKQNVESLYFRHWLGTDSLGRDVLAGLLNGCKIALIVGLTTVFLSLLIGVPLGFLSGFYEDDGLTIKSSHLVLWILISLLFVFYGFYTSGFLSWILFVLPILTLFLILRPRQIFDKGKMYFPMDGVIFRGIEIMNAIPNLFLILMLISLFSRSSLIYVILIIAFIKWPVIVRHLRAEIFKIKQEDFIVGSKSIGQTDWKILYKHILPMAASPLIIVSVFGFSTAVLMESTLSFLGIGVPIDMVTWGSMIKESRLHIDAWWMAFFPGLMIYLVIFLFNSIGDTFNEVIKGQ